MIKFLTITISLFLFFACNNEQNKPNIVQPATYSIPDDNNNNDDPPIPEEVINMKAVLFYDGSLKSLDDNYGLEVIQNADNVIKVDQYYIIDDQVQTLDGKTKWTILSPAQQSCIWGGKLFYYGIDEKLYMCPINGESTEIADNSIKKQSVTLNESGVLIGFTFFFPDGSFETGQYWGYDLIVKLEKIGTTWNKYIYVSDAWFLIGASPYSDPTRCYSIKTTDTVRVFTKGSTLENNQLLEPVYNSAIRAFTGGNAFMFNIQPLTEHSHFFVIGVIDLTAYLLNARDGKIYKYAIDTDTLTPWIEIVIGMANDSIVDAEILFKEVYPFVIGNEILYYDDGGKIQRINVETGEKFEIAEATNFKGWIY